MDLKSTEQSVGVSTAWEYAAQCNINQTSMRRYLQLIDAKPVGKVHAGARRKSWAYTIDDLKKAASLRKEEIKPTVFSMSVAQFAKHVGVKTDVVNRHIRVARLQPTGTSISICRKRITYLYDFEALRGLSQNFCTKPGWSNSHERTVRKYPVADMDKKCAGCGETKPLSQFKRNSSAVVVGRGHHSRCNDCRNEAPKQVNDFNDLCRSFLRGV